MNSVGTIEQMFQDYKDVAEFRMVYINEAHAADGNWPVEYAREKGINEHTNYGERCTTAQMLLDEKQLTIPCLIDGMDNAVNEAYKAWPDRVFLVRTDGVLAVAAARGPWGFEPGLEAASEWLAHFKETGEEPELPASDKEEGEESDSQDDDQR
ncbi:MAG: deiodinase-like protein [Pirellulaceae bacterium]